MPADAVTVVLGLLGVVATLLPLLAVFLEFMTRFFRSDDTDMSLRAKQFTASSLIASVVLLGFGGFLAGDVVRTAAASTDVEFAVAFVQVSLVAAILALGTGGVSVYRQFEPDAAQATSTDRAVD
jgi:uncharacterized membrane protein YbaN (DUF454 family)